MAVCSGLDQQMVDIITLLAADFAQLLADAHAAAAAGGGAGGRVADNGAASAGGASA